MEEVTDHLIEDGYSKVNSVNSLGEYNFTLDTQCPNIMVFDAQNRNALEDSYLVRNGSLIIQVNNTVVT